MENTLLHTKLQVTILTVLNSLIPISKGEICQIHPDISPTTVEAVLGAMVKDGQIRKIGKGRVTKYLKID